MSDKQQQQRTWDELYQMFRQKSRTQIEACASRLAMQPQGKLTEEELYKVWLLIGPSRASDIAMVQTSKEEREAARREDKMLLDSLMDAALARPQNH